MGSGPLQSQVILPCALKDVARSPPLRIPLRVPMPRATSLEQPGSHLHFSLCVLVSKVRLRTRAEETCPPTLSSRRFPGVYRVQACCLYRNHKILVQTTLPGFCAAVFMGIIFPSTCQVQFSASPRQHVAILVFFVRPEHRQT